MSLMLAPGTAWADVLARIAAVAPEAFAADRLRNLYAGRWHDVGTPAELRTPVDGTLLTHLAKVGAGIAAQAVAAAQRAHLDWAGTPLAERKARVAAAVDALSEHRDLLALALAWEIGKPWRLACADVDRALDGVRWYLGRSTGRSPGGSRCRGRSATSPRGTIR